MTEQLDIPLTFIAYLLIVFVIGWFGYRKTQDLSDYILGGRRLGRWVTALSAGASDMSGWLLLGLPGYAYVAGLEAGWIAIGLFLGTYLNWKFIAPRLRVKSEAANNALTIPDLLEYHFNDNSHLIRITSAILILVFYLFYTGAGLVAAGKLFESVFQLPYAWAVIIGTITIVVYTLFGGFLAVSWTDLFQGLLMVLALVITAGLLMQELGGLQTGVEKIQAVNPALVDLFTDAQARPLTWITILSLLSWGLGYFGQPHILARFMAIRSERIIPGARWIAVSWTGLCLLCAVTIGLFGIGLLQQPLAQAQSEQVFLKVLPILFHPMIAGLCLAAILAAIMSTADSQLLVAASAVTEDLYKNIFNKQTNERYLVIISRLAVLLLAIAALLLALDPKSKVLELVAYAWAGFGAAFGPILISILYFENRNKITAMAGIVSGAVTVVVWKSLQGGLFDIYELLPGFLISGITILVLGNVFRHS